ncbi:MAG: S53 family peptidase [Lentilactobacillus diolivorans]|uniref:S53 family peptidase n=1 Tax=Lentilactobacillus diolivorans TaxID=179838 RepID=UPI0039E91D42
MRRKLKWLGLVLSPLVCCVLVGGQTQAASTSSSVSDVYKKLTTAKNLPPTPVKKRQTTYFDIILKSQNSNHIENDALAVNTPGDTNFKHYLTPNQFGRKYGASPILISQWVKLLKHHSLKAVPLKNRLIIRVFGKVNKIDRLFQTNLNKAKYHQKPVQFGTKTPRIPKKLSRTVWTIIGLTDHNRDYIYPDTSLPFKRRAKKRPSINSGFTSRFTKHYHVTPLYKQQLTGKGQTIGIIAFENVRKANIFRFWRHEKVATNPSRLQIKNVFSPPYCPSEDIQNSDETTMDAEYAGSVAPDANVKIYLSNTDSNLTNFIDVYEQAFNDNVVSSTTNSYGLLDSGSIAILRHRHLLTPVYRQVLSFALAQGAIQGISNFTASGDSGALNYMVKSENGRELMLDRTLNSSDFFDSNPFITSVGGTTLPFRVKTGYGTIINKHERAWGTDYLWPFFQKQFKLVQKFPNSLFINGMAGSTGGFSHQYQTPTYQLNVPGVNTFKARNLVSGLGQPVLGSNVVTGTDHGRNYPDVAANADPATGYWIYRRTKKHPKNGWDLSGDGTSIASPQYAATAALINSQPGRKQMGFWNPQIYQLAQQSNSPFTPLNSTKDNSNLYYVGQPGTVYNQATGLGITNFDQLAKTYR